MLPADGRTDERTGVAYPYFSVAAAPGDSGKPRCRFRVGRWGFIGVWWGAVGGLDRVGGGLK